MSKNLAIASSWGLWPEILSTAHADEGPVDAAALLALDGVGRAALRMALGLSITLVSSMLDSASASSCS